jgi:hypothetical protein
MSTALPQPIATADATKTVERWGVFELVLLGPDLGRPASVPPFAAQFTCDGRTVHVPGFYDGDGRYVVRFSPDTTGHWRFRTVGGARELDGREGIFVAVGPAAANHGPVDVAATFHFAYADGTPFRPVGATVYNLLHQPDDIYQQTLRAVVDAGFNKLRFLVFPQGGGHVEHLPDRFPFARHADGSWDVGSPDPVFFRRVDQAVRDLMVAGLEADVIVLHPYDRGQFGLDGLAAKEDEVYLRYLVARLSAYRNVWWSLANEYDQLERPDRRWDGLFRELVRADPHARLRSIHNWVQIYDHNKPWVTHASIQNGWAVAEPGRASLYRDVYRKPVVLDEIKYEGDIPERWGNLSGPELVHRFWLATVGGVYAGHGESFLTEAGSLHIVAGGSFRGTSPPRLGFLRRLLDEVDGPGLDPIDKWDDETSTVGISRQIYLQYLGRSSPRRWAFALPQGASGERLQLGDRFEVDVIDTWAMTVESAVASFALSDVGRHLAIADGGVDLSPGRPLAIRVRRIG